jgi:pilus assembly protein CpaC
MKYNMSRLTARFVLMSAICALLLPPAGAKAATRVVRMVVGEQKSMTFKGIDKVIVGNPRVADIKNIGADTFILFATGSGRTNMTVRRRGKSSINFTIVVSKEDVQSLMSEVRKLLGDREGISIRPVGDRVILDGRAFTSEDFRRVNDIVKLYPQVKSFVKVNPNAKKLVANQLNLELQKAGLKNVEASVVGTKIFLEGSVESKADLQKAEMITKAIGEDVENLLTVGIKRMVLVEIDFVEIKKSGTDHIGIKWPLDIEGGVTASVVTTRFFEGPGANSTIMTGEAQGATDFGFGFMFTDGYARVLAQPKLVCASGEKAEFWSGGEVPIVVVTANVVTIDYKKFGVILNISPIADRHGNIQMDVFAEVSDIDRSIGFVGNGIDVPGFVRDNCRTNVTVRHGQTIVLGNLFHIAEEKDVSKVPLLGHIPIIGELFKSRVFREKKAELCVFVTPRIVNPDTPKILKMIADIKSRYKRAKSEVGFGIFD